ncbi:hypothetical protein GCM10023149_48470 [Mucilaginibacter gynuensis]|uniref:HK97 gp10 family phage protein n=1 Tax=Mucilaginibacter gynuensis TaxID=1302236 RepID=A0ABP8HF25_9SPHI
MGIKARFTKDDVRRMVEQKEALIEQAIINRLSYIGETFVRNAREKGTYNDVTGNLRSSIGFVVLRYGKIVKQNFERAGRGKKSGQGVDQAKSFINELKTSFLQGYTLLVVAGMDYAAAVESRGKDVLTASSLIAKADLKRAIKELKNNIRNS